MWRGIERRLNLPSAHAAWQFWRNESVTFWRSLGVVSTALAALLVVVITTRTLDAPQLDYVATLPKGMDTLVGHNATQLSGGQRQRLAIARALYKDAPILILDEATSALDNESERLVQDALKRLMSGRTTLIVAHRISTIEHADRIVVMSEGQILEQGTHAQLMQEKGLYSRLHQIGFGNATSASEH